MASQYSHLQFFRKVPKALLAHYFSSRDALLDVDLTKLKETDVESVLAAFLGLWLVQDALQPPMPHLLERFMDLALPFALGSAFHVWRHRLPMTVWGLLLTAALPILLNGTLFYYPALTLAIGYWSFWLAFVPGRNWARWLHRYNDLGDYSYGMYVYAFPLQGFAVWLLGPQTPLVNMLASLLLTLSLIHI